MTTTKNSKTTAPLAHRVPAEVSDLINTYAEWLTEQTGYKVDPISVYIGSQLRSTFQKTDANQKRIADAAKQRVAQDAAKAKARAEREAAAVTKATEPKVKTHRAFGIAAAAPIIEEVPAKAAPKRPTKAGAKAGSTIATADGVVIAEQTHIDATKAV